MDGLDSLDNVTFNKVALLATECVYQSITTRQENSCHPKDGPPTSTMWMEAWNRLMPRTLCLGGSASRFPLWILRVGQKRVSWILERGGKERNLLVLRRSGWILRAAKGKCTLAKTHETHMIISTSVVCYNSTCTKASPFHTKKPIFIPRGVLVYHLYKLSHFIGLKWYDPKTHRHGH